MYDYKVMDYVTILLFYFHSICSMFLLHKDYIFVGSFVKALHPGILKMLAG